MKTMSGGRQSVIFSLLLVFICNSWAFLFGIHIGVMIPDDPIFAAGTTANLTCCITNGVHNHTGIEFEQKIGNPIANTGLRISETIHNSSCTTLSIYDVQLKDQGIYSCKAGDSIVGKQYVVVGYNLSDLESHFHCISYNEEKLMCYVDMVPGSIKTTFRLFWSRDLSGGWFNCTRYGCEGNTVCDYPYSCTWRRNDGKDAYYTGIPINILVMANNTLGSARFNKTIEVTGYIVKSMPVQNLTSVVLNSTAVSLMWNVELSDHIKWIRNESGGFQYMVQWYSLSLNQSWKETLVSVANELAINISGLVSNHHYNAKVKVKPKGGLYWSAEVEVDFWTNRTGPEPIVTAAPVKEGNQQAVTVAITAITAVTGGLIGLLLTTFFTYFLYKAWRKTRVVIVFDIPPEIEREEAGVNIDDNTNKNGYALVPTTISDTAFHQGSEDSGILSCQDSDNSSSSGTPRSSHDPMCPITEELDNQKQKLIQPIFFEAKKSLPKFSTMQKGMFSNEAGRLDGDMLFKDEGMFFNSVSEDKNKFKFTEKFNHFEMKKSKFPVVGYALLGEGNATENSGITNSGDVTCVGDITDSSDVTGFGGDVTEIGGDATVIGDVTKFCSDVTDSSPAQLPIGMGSRTSSLGSLTEDSGDFSPDKESLGCEQDSLNGYKPWKITTCKVIISQSSQELDDSTREDEFCEDLENDSMNRTENVSLENSSQSYLDY